MTSSRFRATSMDGAHQHKGLFPQTLSPPPVPAKSSSPSRRWLLSKTQTRPSSSAATSVTKSLPLTTTHSIVPLPPSSPSRTFSNDCSNGLETDTETFFQDYPELHRPIYLTSKATPLPSSPAALTTESAQPPLPNSISSRSLSGARTGSKIGKSFETLLASDETWILGQSTAVPKGIIADSGSSTALRMPASAAHSSASVNTKGVRPEAAHNLAPVSRWSPRTDDVTMLSSSPPAFPPTGRGGLGHRKSNQSIGSRAPSSPRKEIKVKQTSIHERDIRLESPKGSKASLNGANSAPSPSAIPVLPPKSSERHLSAHDNRSSPRSRQSTTDSVPVSIGSGVGEAAASGSGPSSDMSGGYTSGPQGGFRDRFKRTSGFLKRLTARDISGGSSADEKRSYGKQNLPGARASTPSLYHGASFNEQQTTNMGATFLPPSPSPGRGKVFASELHPIPVPAIPAIPAKYADVSLALRPPSNDTRVVVDQADVQAEDRPARSSAVLSRTTVKSPQCRSAGLEAPLTAPLAGRSMSAPSAAPLPSTANQLSSLPSKQGAVPKSNSASKALAMSGMGPGVELRSTLQVWEREMDKVLKESARNLEEKTKIVDKSGWEPSPTLPELGIDVALDDDSKDGEELQSLSSGRGLSQTRMREPSSDPNTTGPGGGRSSRIETHGGRPTSSRSGTTILVDGKPMHRPWERSRSPFLAQGDDADFPTSSTAMGKSLSADEDHLPVRTITSDSLPTPISSQAPRDLSAHRVLPLSLSATTNRRSSVSTLPTPPVSASRMDGIVGSPAASSLRDGMTRDSVSGASIITFETAAESDEATVLGAIRALRDGPREGASEELDDDDEGEDEIAIHPERSIRLITDKGLAPPLSHVDAGNDSTATIVLMDGRQSPHHNLHHHGRDESTISPLPSERDRSRALPWSAAATMGSRASLVGRHSLPPSSSSSTTHMRPHGLPDTSRDSESDIAADKANVRATQARAKELADLCWTEDETWMHREKIAEWLGGVGALNDAARDYYLEYFDFQKLRVDAALRALCDKLFLRAETQQVDRILAAFSRRYWSCNPSSVYGSADSIHAIVFSLLLLNTDLHVADISDRMTKQQFVKNTLSALSESEQSEQDSQCLITSSRPRQGGKSWTDRDSDSVSLQSSGWRGEKTTLSSSMDQSMAVRRGSISSLSAAPIRGNSAVCQKPSLARSSPIPPQIIHNKGETDLEASLKEMYTAVKNDRIRLPMSDVAPPDHLKSFSGRKGARPHLGPPPVSLNSSGRVQQIKRGSLRGMAGLLGVTAAIKHEEHSISPLGSQSSFGSRSINDAWTSGQAIGESRPSDASTAVTSATSAATGAHAASLGFANSLFAQNVVREAREEDTASVDGRRPASIASTVDDLDDNDLALIGAPWAKEGVLARKHYWEAPQKRARDKNWTETFVVVQKGTLSMFKFGDNTSTSGSKAGSASYGGGNWLSNATSLGELPLAHTIANALPPPGYNRARPHVLAVTLPSGAVYFFQAGTEDLVTEWVSTCNYWAARTSRPPLAGGVSNMEYGWNKVLSLLTDGEGSGPDHDEPGEYLVDDGASSQGETPGSTWSNLATPPDASIYQTLASSGKGGNGAHADNRSVRSVRSGRSMASSVGGTYFQSWQDAASKSMSGGGSGGVSPAAQSGRSNVGGSITSGYHSGGGGLSPPSSHRSRAPASLRSVSSLQPSRLGFGESGGSGRPTNDRMNIHNWKMPAAPSVPSALKEEEQMEACIAFISRTEAELTAHNELRQPMLGLYNPRGSNYSKALSNWERKSGHLLTELVKWKGYVESLSSASKLRMEKRDERAMNTALARADEEMAKVKESEEGGPVMMTTMTTTTTIDKGEGN